MAWKILLVDDNASRRDSVKTILNSGSNYAIEGADCRNALTLLTQQKFDLILIDLTLRDQHGFSVLEYLEKNHIASKVMAITGTTGLANLIRGSTPGAEEVLTKPYSPDDLLKSIDHVLSDRAQANLRLQIIKAGDFIKSTPTGDLDLQASKDGLAQIAGTGTTLQDYTILIDLRGVKSLLSIAQIFDLATELVTYGKTFRRKTAILARDDKDFSQATFFETAAQNQGFRVRAFTVFEDALVWLSNVTHLAEEQ